MLLLLLLLLPVATALIRLLLLLLPVDALIPSFNHQRARCSSLPQRSSQHI